LISEEDFNKFDKYMKLTWIGDKNVEPAKEPLFPHNLWSCYQLTIDEKPRTNNANEGYNNRINNLVGKENHSVCFMFLE
jgi:hypothetical protein